MTAPTTMTERRRPRKRPHAALAGRVLATGLAAGSSVGIVGLLARADQVAADPAPTSQNFWAIGASAAGTLALHSTPPSIPPTTTTVAPQVPAAPVPAPSSAPAPTSPGAPVVGAPPSGPVATTPPPVATAPPVAAPPVTAPPVTAPPVTAPPVTAPPVTAPPTTPTGGS